MPYPSGTTGPKNMTQSVLAGTWGQQVQGSHGQACGGHPAPWCTSLPLYPLPPALSFSPWGELSFTFLEREQWCPLCSSGPQHCLPACAPQIREFPGTMARPQLCPSTQHVLVGIDQRVIYKWNRFSERPKPSHPCHSSVPTLSSCLGTQLFWQ